MAKAWDITLKKLVQANPQDFVTLIQPGLQIEAQLQSELDREHVYADGVYFNVHIQGSSRCWSI